MAKSKKEANNGDVREQHTDWQVSEPAAADHTGQASEKEAEAAEEVQVAEALVYLGMNNDLDSALERAKKTPKPDRAIILARAIARHEAVP